MKKLILLIVAAVLLFVGTMSFGQAKELSVREKTAVEGNKHRRHKKGRGTFWFGVSSGGEYYEPYYYEPYYYAPPTQYYYVPQPPVYYAPPPTVYYQPAPETYYVPAQPQYYDGGVVVVR